MSKPAKLKFVSPRCARLDCRRYAYALVLKWGRDHGPYCKPHAEEEAAAMDAAEARWAAMVEERQEREAAL